MMSAKKAIAAVSLAIGGIAVLALVLDQDDGASTAATSPVESRSNAATDRQSQATNHAGRLSGARSEVDAETKARIEKRLVAAQARVDALRERARAEGASVELIDALDRHEDRLIQKHAGLNSGDE